jgi:hypothetical protein
LFCVADNSDLLLQAKQNNTAAAINAVDLNVMLVDLNNYEMQKIVFYIIIHVEWQSCKQSKREINN